jgi:hypothetical protein
MGGIAGANEAKLPGWGGPAGGMVLNGRWVRVHQHEGDAGAASGRPLRILFAFDPNRAAILLVGGNKRGDKRWYKKSLPIADERYRRHLELLKQ